MCFGVCVRVAGPTAAERRRKRYERNRALTRGRARHVPLIIRCSIKSTFACSWKTISPFIRVKVIPAGETRNEISDCRPPLGNVGGGGFVLG